MLQGLEPSSQEGGGLPAKKETQTLWCFVYLGEEV